jgi:hypothetical protein
MPRLELQIDAEDPVHVHGTIRADGGEDVAFVGWVGLLAVLQQAVT